MSQIKILFLDIETLPNLAQALKFWTSLSNPPGHTLKASLSSIACVGYKWAHEKSTHCIAAWHFPKNWKKDVNDDRAVVEKALEIISEADCIVTHNGKKFDWPFLQTRLLYHCLGQLPKIPHIDTKQEASRHLFLHSNRLATLAEEFTQEKKKDSGGWSLWLQVSNRSETACRQMEMYCKQDVRALEAIFERLRPMITKIPNINIVASEKVVCPKCGSWNITRHGIRYMKSRIAQRYKCNSCLGWSSQTISQKFPTGD